MCVSSRHPECQVGHALLVLGYDVFIPALFHLPLDCFFFCGLQVVMNLVHLSTSSCSIVPPMAIFVFSVCYIFLSDTHSQYEHTEGSLNLDKCNMLGKSCLN